MASVILHADFESCEQQVAAQSPLTGFGISLCPSATKIALALLMLMGGRGGGGEGGPGGFGGCWSSNRKELGGAEGAPSGDFFLFWRLILGDHVSINAAFMKSNFLRWEEQDWFFFKLRISGNY